MDLNDFLYVSSMYNPRASASRSESTIVVLPVSNASTVAPARQLRPAALMPPPSRASSDIVAEDPSSRPSLTAPHDDLSRLSQGRSPISDSGAGGPFDQYGSHLSQGGDGFYNIAECKVSPVRQPSPSHHSSPPISPTHPSLTRGDNPLHSQDVDLLSQPEVVSSSAQLMDVDTQHTPVRPRAGDAEHVHASAARDETARVLPFVREVEMINCSDVESCDFKRHLLGDSSDGDSDEDDVGINSGVALPATHPSAGGGPAPSLDCVPTASTDAARLSTPAANEFYNAVGKAPHPDAIIPKTESGWWAKRELRKQKKAEEKAKAALELQQIQERAAALAEQNATLQRELDLAQCSISETSAPAVPSTSAASVGGPEVQESGRNAIGFCTPIGEAVDPVPPTARLAAISLRACGGRSDEGGTQIYPRVEHSPSPLELHYHTPEDSLRFQIKEDVNATRSAEGAYGLSPHVAGSDTLKVSRASSEDVVVAGDEGEEEEGSDGEEEEGEEGNDEDQEDRLDYGSSPEVGAGEGEAHPGNRIRSEVHVVEYDDSGSDQVI